MTDTTLDSKLDRIRAITDRLAYNYCNLTVTSMYEEPDLLSALHRLNTEFEREMAKAQRRHPGILQGTSGKVIAGFGMVLAFAAGLTILMIILGIAYQGLAASAYPAR